MLIIVFEELKDAKRFEKTDLDDIDQEMQDDIDENNFIMKRKGKVVFFGTKTLVNDLLDELSFLPF